MLRLRHLGSARFAAVFMLGAFACAPIVGCGSSTDTGTGDDDTGTTDDSSVDSGGDDTTVKPDTGGKDTNVDDTTVPTDTTPPPDTTGTDTSGTDTSGTDTSGTDTSGTDTTGTDTSGTDTSGTDTATDSGTDAVTDSGTDTSTDSGPTCPSGSSCTTSGGAAGLCAADNTTCAACVDTTDDAKCATAYGTGNICVGGACVPGNCHSDAACSSPTPTCGFLVANTCGGCTSDSQCTTTGTICATTGASAGKCVSNACSVGSANACTTNPSDICCGGICVPGTPKASGGCCVAGDCGSGFSTCTGASSSPVTSGVCTACTLPTGGAPFIVDPVNGNDATGTGGSGGCAFKTIGRAIAFLGARTATTTIQVVSGATLCTTTSATCTTIEPNPIRIPTNIVVQGAGTGATLVLPAAGFGGGLGSTGFLMANPNSSLQNITIDGGAHVGSHGVVVAPGSVAATTTISGVIVKNMANEGILVSTFVGGGGGGSAGVTIGAGTTVTGSGTTGATRSGLRLQGNSTAIITGSSTAPISFSSNTQHGIEVDNTSSVTINGTPGGGASVGTVVANTNTVAGLFINQVSGGGALPLNTVNGLVVYGTTAGNGIRIAAGSNVKIRSTSSLGNSGSGIHIAAGGFGGSTSMANIDLGKAGDFGNNSLQMRSVSGTTPNGGAGICIELAAGAGAAVTLAAQGNTFGGTSGASSTLNCATAASGTLKVTATAAGYSCAGGNDVGVSNSTSYKVDVTKCSYP